MITRHLQLLLLSPARPGWLAGVWGFVACLWAAAMED